MNDEIYQWGDLNIERIEPALERIGKTLFCFDNLNKINNDCIIFEKNLSCFWYSWMGISIS